MTDLEFLTFIRECTLSNEEIAEHYGHTTEYIRKWRQGEDTLLDPEIRKVIAREISMLEMTRLSEQIQAQTDKQRNSR